MTVTEVREVRERISQETSNLKGDDYYNYYRFRAQEMQKQIESLREKKETPD